MGNKYHIFNRVIQDSMFLKFLLISCVIISFYQESYATTTFNYSDGTASTSSDTVLSQSSRGNRTDVVSVSIGSEVTAIGTKAFWFCTNLPSITIPTSVTSIGYDAFSACNSITNIIIPTSVTELGAYAFAGTGASQIVIPDSVTSIGIWAFASNFNLENIIIGKGVTAINDFTFTSAAKLSSVTFLGNAPLEGSYIFDGSPNVKNIYYYPDTTGWGSTWAGVSTSLVPEPSALSLLAIGLGGLAILRRRRS